MENAWLYLIAVHFISLFVFGIWYAVAYNSPATINGDEFPTTVGTNSARS